MALGLDVAVEQDLLAGHLDVGRELRRRPVIGGGERRSALDSVLLAFDGATVVPPVATSRRDGEVGLESASLDLAEDRLLKARQVRRALLRVRVLGLEMRDDGRLLLGAEPLVRVFHVVAVMAADDRVACGDGCCAGGFGGHRPTLADALRPEAAAIGLRTARAVAPCAAWGPRSGCRAKRAATGARARSGRRTRCAATRAETRRRSLRAARPPPGSDQSRSRSSERWMPGRSRLRPRCAH